MHSVHTGGAMAKQRQIFVYDDIEDVDIADWLDAQGNKSEAIRGAIRGAMGGGDDTLTRSDLREVLRDELARVAVAAGCETSAGPQARDDDPEAGAMLDSMFE